MARKEVNQAHLDGRINDIIKKCFQPEPFFYAIIHANMAVPECYGLQPITDRCKTAPLHVLDDKQRGKLLWGAVVKHTQKTII